MSSGFWETYLSIAPSTSSVPAENRCARRPKAGVARNVVVSVGSSAPNAIWDNSPSRSGSIKTLLTAPWDYWKNEREIQETTRALARLDDHTLRDLGIPDRSQIEFTVRFCREC
jgi:uncharacterized protein YjiS (DUF1127 family)